MSKQNEKKLVNMTGIINKLTRNVFTAVIIKVRSFMQANCQSPGQDIKLPEKDKNYETIYIYTQWNIPM
jgi:Holliday junction resolvasome RuvABC DNA-binding subunit